MYNMSHRVIINPSTDIDVSEIQFHKIYKGNPTRMSLSYDGQKIFFNGPRMKMASSIIKKGEYYYINLYFDLDSPKNQKFMKMIKNVDNMVVSKIYDNTQLWYGDDNIPLSQIESEFIPTIKVSTVYVDRNMLLMKVHESEIEFYDQENVSIPYELIQEDSIAIPLLELSYVSKNDHNIWIDWKLVQLKVEQVNDTNDDSKQISYQLVSDSDSDISDAEPDLESDDEENPK